MFITIFHCFLLFVQLLISDSSTVYNKKLFTVSSLIQEKKYDQSIKLLMDLERKSIFKNPQLDNTLILLLLKEGKSSPKKSSNNILNAIIFFEKNSRAQSIEILKSEITNKQSDTCIKWFEIFNARILKYNLNQQVHSSDKSPEAKFDKKDALEILNLMKNKEKYIKYE